MTPNNKPALLDASGNPVIPEYTLGFVFQTQLTPPLWLVCAGKPLGQEPRLLVRLTTPQTSESAGGSAYVPAHEQLDLQTGTWHYTAKVRVVSGQPVPRPDIGWEMGGAFMYLVEQVPANDSTATKQ